MEGHQGRSITGKLLAMVVFASALFFMVVSAIQIGRQSQSSIASADADVRTVIDNTKSAISGAVWNYDIPALTSILQGVVQSGTIMRVIVRDQNELLASVTRPGFSGKIDRVQFEPLIAEDGRRVLGQMEIDQSYVSLRASLALRIRDDTIATLIEIAGLAGLIFVILDRTIVRHVRALAAQVGRLDPADPSTRLALARAGRSDDELSALVNALNAFHRLCGDEMLRRSEAESRVERVVRALDLASEGILITEGQKILYRNKALDEIVGTGMIAKSDGFTVRQFLAGFPESDLEMVKRVNSELGATQRWTGHVNWLRPTDQSRRTIFVNAMRLPNDTRIFLVSDSTERIEGEVAQSRLLRDLEQSQRMEGLGALAGGVAHDFNNLLGAISGFAGFIEEDTPESDPSNRYAKRILGAAEQGKNLVRKILSFASQSASAPVIFPIRDLLRETLELARMVLADTAELSVDIEDARGYVRGDRSFLAQVIINLCVNARDAQTGGVGAIRVAARDAGEGSPNLALLVAAEGEGNTRRTIELVRQQGERVIGLLGATTRERRYVVLSVEDDGTGMSQETLSRIFDPFFTTKSARNGTGLGLATAQAAILGHGGAILVDTERGRGTRFEVYLPVMDSDPLIESDGEPHAEGRLDGEGMRVLLVDDSEEFAEMVEGRLRREGFDVRTCHSAIEALQVFQQSVGDWSLLITDQTMPGLKGIDLIQSVKAIRPGLPCILLTGYAATLTMQEAMARGADQLLYKPFPSAELVGALRAVLANPPGSKPDA